MRAKEPTGRPCQTCGLPHTWTRETGWKADNGTGKIHGYLQGDEYPPLTVVPDAKPAKATKPGTSKVGVAAVGNYDVIFGEFAFCRRCGNCTSNTRDGMTNHDALHTELEWLRAEVDRLARIIDSAKRIIRSDS